MNFASQTFPELLPVSFVSRKEQVITESRQALIELIDEWWRRVVRQISCCYVRHRVDKHQRQTTDRIVVKTSALNVQDTVSLVEAAEDQPEQ